MRQNSISLLKKDKALPESVKMTFVAMFYHICSLFKGESTAMCEKQNITSNLMELALASMASVHTSVLNQGGALISGCNCGRLY